MNDIVKKEDAHIIEDSQPSFAQMVLEMARDPSVDVDKMNALVDFQERLEEKEAKIAFEKDFAAFTEEAPTIYKDKKVKNQSGQHMYNYAPFDKVIETIKPLLQKHGIFPRWESRVLKDGTERTCVTCFLVHKETGYSVYSDQAGKPAVMGGKAGIQGVGASDTYLRRYSLCNVAGLLIVDEDTDGHIKPDTIGKADIAAIQDLLSSTNSDVKAFCDMFNVDAIAKLPKTELGYVMRLLNKKQKDMS